MSHEASCVAFMWDPAKRLGEVVRTVDSSRDAMQLNFLRLLPILNSKTLNVDVSRTFSRNFRVDHANGRHVVFTDRSRRLLRKAEFEHDGAKVLGVFGGKDGSEELCFGGASSSD